MFRITHAQFGLFLALSFFLGGCSTLKARPGSNGGALVENVPETQIEIPTSPYEDQQESWQVIDIERGTPGSPLKVQLVNSNNQTQGIVVSIEMLQEEGRKRLSQFLNSELLDFVKEEELEALGREFYFLNYTSLLDEEMMEKEKKLKEMDENVKRVMTGINSRMASKNQQITQQILRKEKAELIMRKRVCCLVRILCFSGFLWSLRVFCNLCCWIKLKLAGVYKEVV